MTLSGIGVHTRGGQGLVAQDVTTTVADAIGPVEQHITDSRDVHSEGGVIGTFAVSYRGIERHRELSALLREDIDRVLVREMLSIDYPFVLLARFIIVVRTGRVAFVLNHNMAGVGEHHAVLAVGRLVFVIERRIREPRQNRAVEVEVAIVLIQIGQTATIGRCIGGIHLQRTIRRNDGIGIMNRSPLVRKTIRCLSGHLGVIATADTFNFGLRATQTEIAVSIVTTLRAVIGCHGNLEGLAHKTCEVDTIGCPLFPGQVALIMPSVAFVSGGAARIEVGATAVGIHFLAILVFDRQGETRLLTLAVAGVFQHHCVLEQQDRIHAIHVVIIRNRLPFGTGVPVAETYGSQLTIRNQRQTISRTNIICMNIPIDGMTAGHIVRTVIDYAHARCSGIDHTL